MKKFELENPSSDHITPAEAPTPASKEPLSGPVGPVGALPETADPTDAADEATGTLATPAPGAVQHQPPTWWFEPQHEQRLRDRAMDLALAYQEGARSCDEQTARQLLKNPKIRGDALVYCYNHVSPPYYRAILDPTLNKSKIVGMPRVTPPPFFMSTASTSCTEWQVHESLEKAQAAFSAGFPGVVGLSGVSAGLLTKAQPGKPATLHSLAAKYIKPGDTVRVVMDAGRMWNPNVAAAEARTARALIEHGCEVLLVQMPPDAHGTLSKPCDQGADDFIYRHGAAAYAKLVHDAVAACPIRRAQSCRHSPDDLEDLRAELPFQASVRVMPEHRFAELAEAMDCSVDDVVAIAEEFERRLIKSAPMERGDEVEIADFIISALGCRSDLVFDQGRVHGFENGVWQRLEPETLRALGAGLAGRWVHYGDKPRKLCLSYSAIEGGLKILSAKLYRKDYFNQAPLGAVFANGFVTVEGNEVRVLPHHRKHRARHRYECDYTPGQQPVAFLGFLDSCFQGDSDGAEKKRALQEYLGACVLGVGARTKRLLILAGDTNSGKSTTLEIVRALFPLDAVCCVPPASFSNDYHRAGLRAKLINLVSEMPERELVDASSLKAVIGNDLISGRPIYEAPVTFVPTAGHLFATNTLPAIRDTSEASHKRLLILTYNNRFAQGKEDQGDQLANPNIAKEIIELERDEILSWCIDGAVRVVANSFVVTEPPSSKVALAELRTDTDPVRRFVEEECELDPGHRVPAKTLYDAYAEWAQQGGFGRLNRSNFGRAVAALLRARYPKQKPTGSNASKDRTYRGVRLSRHRVSLDVPIADPLFGRSLDEVLS